MVVVARISKFTLIPSVVVNIESILYLSHITMWYLRTTCSFVVVILCSENNDVLIFFLGQKVLFQRLMFHILLTIWDEYV